jgi:hypothetical protein
MRKINLEKLKWLAEHAFLVFLVLVLVALILGAAMFYKYNILVKKAEPEIKETPLQFKKNIYQNILEEWEGREERFKEADIKEHLDPFSP